MSGDETEPQSGDEDDEVVPLKEAQHEWTRATKSCLKKKLNRTKLSPEKKKLANVQKAAFEASGKQYATDREA